MTRQRHGVTELAALSGKGRGDKVAFVTVAADDLEAYRGSRARTGRVLQGALRTVTGFAEQGI